MTDKRKKIGPYQRTLLDRLEFVGPVDWSELNQNERRGAWRLQEHGLVEIVQGSTGDRVELATYEPCPVCGQQQKQERQTPTTQPLVPPAVSNSDTVPELVVDKKLILNTVRKLIGDGVEIPANDVYRAVLVQFSPSCKINDTGAAVLNDSENQCVSTIGKVLKAMHEKGFIVISDGMVTIA